MAAPVDTTLDQPSGVAHRLERPLLVSLIHDTLGWKQWCLWTHAMFTAMSDTPWPFLADLVRYQCDFSPTRENNRDLSITTRGHLHVMEEVCRSGVAVGASRWTLSSCFGPPNA
jgi:hypothetical protein